MLQYSAASAAGPRVPGSSLHCSTSMQASFFFSVNPNRLSISNRQSSKGRLLRVLPRWRRGISVCYLPNSSEISNSPSPDRESKSKTEAVVGPGSVMVSSVSGYLRNEGFESLGGNSGSVSFCGLSHQSIEERKLVSSPFVEGKGSIYWVFGPIALISSLLLPQVFLGNVIEGVFRDEILAEIVSSFASELIFYAGLAVFLFVTDHVQRPYLEFSSKRWSLITGLKGYLSSAFFAMGFKVFTPVLAVYVAWPVLGLSAAVAVAPFLLGCAAQFLFEMRLDRHDSSSWPLVPIIFEIYRLYQLTRGAHFIEKLLFSMREATTSMTPAVMERGNSLLSMVVLLQVLGVVCLWSLTTFLLRLFPSRPVAEKY